MSRPKPGYVTGTRERKSYTLPEPVASLKHKTYTIKYNKSQNINLSIIIKIGHPVYRTGVSHIKSAMIIISKYINILKDTTENNNNKT